MRLIAFDHVNVHTEDADRLAEWYEDVLGLRRGSRPSGLGVEGEWLYLGDAALLHLVSASGIERAAIPALEHFAFRATGLPEFLVRLSEREIDHTLFEVPELGIVQVNITDRDGNHIHVDFPMSEIPD